MQTRTHAPARLANAAPSEEAPGMSPAGGQASGRMGWLTVVLGALTAFAPFSIDMYLPGLPTLQREFGTTASAAQLTLAAFITGLGLGQFMYGPLADRFGRRRPLAVGIGVYVLASLGCAFAPNIETLIALRFVQALGGAAGPVIARAIVRDLHAGREAARMLSTLMLVMGVAPVLAPLTGAWVLGVAGWRAIFRILMVLGVVCLVASLRVLPETAPTSGGRAASLGVSMRALFADRRFTAFTLVGGFAQSSMFAYIIGSPFVLIALHGVSPRVFSCVFAANAVALIGASQLNRRLLVRHSPSRVIVPATVGATVIGGVIALVGATGVGGLPAILVSLFLFMACVGFTTPNSTALALEGHGPRAGLASAVLGSVQYALSAGVTALVSLLNDGSAKPMTFGMAACGVASALTCVIALRGHREPEHA